MKRMSLYRVVVILRLLWDVVDYTDLLSRSKILLIVDVDTPSWRALSA